MNYERLTQEQMENAARIIREKYQKEIHDCALCMDIQAGQFGWMTVPDLYEAGMITDIDQLTQEEQENGVYGLAYTDEDKAVEIFGFIYNEPNEPRNVQWTQKIITEECSNDQTSMNTFEQCVHFMLD